MTLNQREKKGHFFSLTVLTQILFYTFFLCIPVSRDASECENGQSESDPNSPHTHAQTFIAPS